jgi:hypothetical protein
MWKLIDPLINHSTHTAAHRNAPTDDHFDEGFFYNQVRMPRESQKNSIQKADSAIKNSVSGRRKEEQKQQLCLVLMKSKLQKELGPAKPLALSHFHPPRRPTAPCSPFLSSSSKGHGFGQCQTRGAEAQLLQSL